MNQPKAKKSLFKISPYICGKSSYDGMKLSSNENPYGASEKAKKAYIDEAQNLNRYPDGGAIKLCEAIAKANNLLAKNIICGAGSDELIGLLINAYAGHGDEILYSQYGFLMYKIYALSNGAMPITALEKNLRTDIYSILKSVTPRTKIVFIANPNNPTGSYVTADELQELREKLPENIILAIDAAYSEYVEEDDYSNGLELVADRNNTVMFRTFSKIYGLSALRLGWIYAPDNIIDVLHRIRSPFNVNSAAQRAGIAAVKDADFVEKHKILNNKQKQFLSDGLRGIRYKPFPSSGNFILCHFGEREKAENILKYLMDNNIFVRSTASYGLPEYLRITVGTKDENQKILDILQDF